MAHTVAISRAVAKQLDALPTSARDDIGKALVRLQSEPRPLGCVKLKGYNAWRIRVGSYRVIYEIHDAQLVIVLIRVAHRRDAYR